MANKKSNVNNDAIDIGSIRKSTLEVCVLGTSPIILNRMSEKAMHELLLPRGKKNAAEKASTLKHEPMEEFRASPYVDRDESAPTLLQHLSAAFKKAMSGAALDLPGASKAQIGRLVWVEGERVPIWGVPQMLMSVTRSADMNKTPDVRTRAIVPQWATRFKVSFTESLIKTQSVVNLLASAGITQGIGDWRTGKGSGTYGAFEIVGADDARFKTIIKLGGRKAQLAAMESPEAYDEETRELFAWWRGEVTRRGFKSVG